MSLATFLDDVGHRRRTVTVYADDPDTDRWRALEGWNVDVEYAALPAEFDGGFVTVHRNGTFLGSVDITALAALFEPTRVGTRAPRPAETGVGKLLELLDRTLFRALDRRQLLAASREFEDRAWRVAEGRIHAGFQRPAALAAQRNVYEWLAERGLDVHVYFDGTWPHDRLYGPTVHTATGTELGRYWFVAYDGGSQPEQACGLLAEERREGAYHGFFTYDESAVGALAEYLESTYW